MHVYIRMYTDTQTQTLDISNNSSTTRSIQLYI